MTSTARHTAVRKIHALAHNKPIIVGCCSGKDFHFGSECSSECKMGQLIADAAAAAVKCITIAVDINDILKFH